MRVAIVALGPSANDYIRYAEGCGNLKEIYDEVWVVNTFGSVLKCDLVFHMDDVRVQMRRAEHNSKIASLVEWLRTYEGRVITSRAHPDFPCLEEYPLEEVLNLVRVPYFNGTVAYAMAYAIWREDVTDVSLYGVDYNWRGASELEPGRACLEYWMGRATERGMGLRIAPTSTLMDTNCRTLYGYDTLIVRVGTNQDTGRISVQMEPKEEFASGKEVEERYDHSIKRETENVEG